MAHYDDEVLFEYVEGSSPIASEIESHVSTCEHCATEVGDHRRIIAAMGDSDVWQTPSPAAPRQFVLDVVAFAERAKREDERAAILCDEILTGPSSWWAQRLRKAEGAFTAGMVKQLLERMRAMLGTSPVNALAATALAIEVANTLEVSEYPSDYAVKLRAQAFRDHAFVLSFMGRYPEALSFADRAKRLFEQVPLPEYDLARVALVRALILRYIDRNDEAVALTREAAETFLRFGDAARYVNARITEGVMLYQAKAVDAALEVWSSLENNPALDELGAAQLLYNIAICHGELRHPEVAAEYLQRCIPQFELLGRTVERTRCRAAMGSALAAVGRTQDAIPHLRQARREFEELEMTADAALVALELAEVLLGNGQTEDVAAICRDLIARFTKAGMTSRAVTALSFLREALAIGQATPSLIRHVHSFLRELPAEQPRLYAQPADRFGD